MKKFRQDGKLLSKSHASDYVGGKEKRSGQSDLFSRYLAEVFPQKLYPQAHGGNHH